MSRLGVAFTVLLLTTADAAAGPSAAATIGVPIVVHVTRGDDGAIADAAEVATLVAAVNRLYDGSGVCFVVREIREVDRPAALETYRDRRAFRRFLVSKALNVFLVTSIRDPHTSESTARALARVGRKASGWLAGAEIPAPRRKPSRYLIVRLLSGAETLAHELGHFLGEGHHKDPTNLMSYGNERRGFNDKQLRAFAQRVRREVRSGNLTKTPCP